MEYAAKMPHTPPLWDKMRHAKIFSVSKCDCPLLSSLERAGPPFSSTGRSVSSRTPIIQAFSLLSLSLKQDYRQISLGSTDTTLACQYPPARNEKPARRYSRRALDCVIFDALGLTQGERDAVYEAVVELVRRRLEKGESV